MPNDIEQLLKDHKRLIDSEAAKYAKFVPLTFVQMEAHKLARKAAHDFTPTRGVKFSTYLTNALQKLSRLSTQHGNIIRIPEDKQFKIHRLNQVEQGLKELYGREPTVQELGDALGLNTTATLSLLNTRKKNVSLANLVYTPVTLAENDDWVHFVYHDLGKTDKIIFEHWSGFGGKKVMSNNAIAELLKVSPATISQRIKKIIEKLKEGSSA